MLNASFIICLNIFPRHGAVRRYSSTLLGSPSDGFRFTSLPGMCIRRFLLEFCFWLFDVSGFLHVSLSLQTRPRNEKQNENSYAVGSGDQSGRWISPGFFFFWKITRYLKIRSTAVRCVPVYEWFFFSIAEPVFSKLVVQRVVPRLLKRRFVFKLVMFSKRFFFSFQFTGEKIFDKYRPPCT